MMIMEPLKDLNYLLSEHPTIVNFRWSSTQSWGSTWSFLIAAVTAYITLSLTFHNLLLLFHRRRPIPLGPIPALHSLTMSLLSAAIFAGIFSSSVAEIRDTRWFWQRSKTPFQWLLCFPLGTRPSGRVFFWSYMFYLSRFVHVFSTFFKIAKKPGTLPYFQMFHHSVLICTSFLWIEFSQSFQVLAILSLTLMFALTYGYRFSVGIGLKSERYDLDRFVTFCQVVLLVMNMGWHVGVLVLHLYKGGCNGMGAWVFNTVLNSFVLMFVLDFYVKKSLSERDFVVKSEMKRKI